MERRKVFLSHSARDTWVARQLAKSIVAAGAEIFLDEANVQVGDEFPDKIRDFLNVAHELVVLFTPWALDRPWVWSEFGAAWSRKLPIVCVLHGVSAVELQGRPSFPAFLKARDMIDINALDIYIDELRDRCKDVT